MRLDVRLETQRLGGLSWLQLTRILQLRVAPVVIAADCGGWPGKARQQRGHDGIHAGLLPTDLVHRRQHLALGGRLRLLCIQPARRVYNIIEASMTTSGWSRDENDDNNPS